MKGSLGYLAELWEDVLGGAREVTSAQGFLRLGSVRIGGVGLGHPKAGGWERLGETACSRVALRQLYCLMYNLIVP